MRQSLLSGVFATALLFGAAAPVFAQGGSQGGVGGGTTGVIAPMPAPAAPVGSVRPATPATGGTTTVLPSAPIATPRPATPDVSQAQRPAAATNGVAVQRPVAATDRAGSTATAPATQGGAVVR